MTVEIEDNEMEGKSVIITDKEDLPSVPKSHRKLVGPEELAALDDVPGYFQGLAKKTSVSYLCKFLAMLAGCEAWWLELHTTTLCKGGDEAMFRLFFEADISFTVTLQSSGAANDLPPPLKEVYTLINGTNHPGFGYAGGLARLRDIEPMSKSGMWLSEENQLDAGTCFVFYNTFCGDSLCYQLPDQAVWYKHETGALEQAGSLELMVKKYFTGLCKGTILEAYD